MSGYSPLKITGMTSGLVQEREEFLLPDDAYPILQNAYVWRERILRKKGCELLGRLQRNFSSLNFFLTGSSVYTQNILTVSGFVATANNANPGKVTTTYPHGLTTGDKVIISNIVGATGYNNVVFTITVVDSLNFTIGADATGFGAYTSGGQWLSNRTIFGLEPAATLVPGSIIYTIIGSPNIVFTDQGNGTLTSPTAGNSGTINYLTGSMAITTTASSGVAATLSYSYFPGLPVMGIRTRELQNSAVDQTVFFDQKYSYVYNGNTLQFQEFIPGTTWNASNATPTAGTDFFWSTNYWTSFTPTFSNGNQKLFWVTNNTGADGATSDPIRITDGITWVSFSSSTWNQIDSTNFLFNALSMLPFRGRMVMFNTWEGATATGAIQYSNRIRWSTIGNPFIPYAAGPPATGSWRDDIRGRGGYLDIPTSEDIVSVGFVRDNLVIYCERSTWQLRYTGRSIAPFQIEKVNSELGGEGPFSAVQFDTSLVGIGDKGIVECDSYKSERIDIKIPDYVFSFTPETAINNAPFRVHGIRDFINRLAYWTIPLSTDNAIFPTQRLVYNYENDSWALFTDSLTTLGTYQPQSSRNWINTKLPWIQLNFSWIKSRVAEVPAIVGGNQQGFIEYLDEQTTNDYSLYISAITPHTTTPTVITSPNHNMRTGFVIQIGNIPTGTPYDSLNGKIFGIVVVDVNTFKLYEYDPTTFQFSTPRLDISAGSYVGGGMILIRENFNITSKKFNFIDNGQNIQLGYLDILMNATEAENPGAISLYIYQDYNDNEPTNVLPQNRINDYSDPSVPDTFFNSIIPTTQAGYSTMGGSKFWQRVYCATRSSFLTLQYTFSNAQMAGIEQELDVQIDAQILWIRKAGRMVQP